MELREFIATTLVEIQGGVRDAIARTTEMKTNGVINPVWGTVDDIAVEHMQKVSFDIAVSVSDSKSGGVEGGIKVISLQVGGSVKAGQESSSTSRIQFSVPFVPPVQTVQRSSEPL